MKISNLKYSPLKTFEKQKLTFKWTHICYSGKETRHKSNILIALFTSFSTILSPTKQKTSAKIFHALLPHHNVQFSIITSSVSRIIKPNPLLKEDTIYTCKKKRVDKNDIIKESSSDFTCE